MCDSKMFRLSEGMENQYITEDSKVRVYLSAVRSEKKKRRNPTLLEKIITVALEVFYSTTVSYFVGCWAIQLAYKERGYEEIGGEYLLIMVTFLFSLWAVNKFFKSNRG